MTPPPPPMTPDELRDALNRLQAEADAKEQERKRTLHDLHVHQVELEEQNRTLREAQHDLEEARNRFEDLYDFAPVAYYTLNARGVVLEVNLTGATMVGRERAQIIGAPFLSLVTMADSTDFWGHLRRGAESEGPTVTEMHFTTPRSGPRDVQVVSMPVWDTDGKLVGLRSAFTDITERVRAEAEVERLRCEEEQTRKAFQTLDQASLALQQRLAQEPATPVAAIRQLLADLGCDVAEAAGCALGYAETTTPTGNAWTCQGLSCEQADDICRHPLVADPLRAGQTVRLGMLPEDPAFADLLTRHPTMTSLLAIPVTFADRRLGTLLFVNRRDAKAFNDHDQWVAGMLAKRAGVLLSIAQLNESLRTAALARENLLAVVSHDLKSPMQAIELSASLLRAKHGKAPDWQDRKEVEVILGSVSRMDRLINDLLQASMIEAGKFEVTPADVAVPEIVAEALQEASPLAARKGIQVQTDLAADLPVLRGDRHRLRQVLANLIGNALKFTPDGGSVLVSAELTGDNVRLSVSDTGPGIPAEQQPHLFERYWQGRKTGRHGVGLGLYIAKGIVDAHQGRIWAESPDGGGSRFVVTLPLAARP